jgi:isopenicillin N synthase-like dioxygenase
VALPTATKISSAHVPVIDLAAMNGNLAGRRELGRKIGQACADLGFFYIANHGIESAQLAALFRAAEQFFALDEAAKMRVALSSATHYRGYLPLTVMSQKPRWQASEAELKGNLYEAFQIHSELPPDDPDVLRAKPLHGANRWPDGLPALREQMLRYYDHVREFALRMLELFALGLDLPGDRFNPFFTKPMMQLRLIHYPPQDPGDPRSRRRRRPRDPRT